MRQQKIFYTLLLLLVMNGIFAQQLRAPRVYSISSRMTWTQQGESIALHEFYDTAHVRLEYYYFNAVYTDLFHLDESLVFRFDPATRACSVANNTNSVIARSRAILTTPLLNALATATFGATTMTTLDSSISVQQRSAQNVVIPIVPARTMNVTIFTAAPAWKYPMTLPLRIVLQDVNDQVIIDYTEFFNGTAAEDVFTPFPECLIPPIQPPFPKLPPQFVVQLQNSDIKHKVTREFVQYYDAIGSQMRLDSYTPEGRVSTWYFASSAARFKAQASNLDSVCNETPLSDAELTQYNGTGLPSVEDIFLLNSGMGSRVYTGQKQMRGITCDVWKRTWSNNTHIYTISHGFAVNDWKFRSNSTIKTPVRVSLQVRPIGTLERPESNVIDYNVDYVDFLPVQIPAAYALPIACPSSTERYQVRLIDAAGVTALVGVFVGLACLCLGLGIGVVVGWIVFKRRPGQSKTSQPQQLSE